MYRARVTEAIYNDDYSNSHKYYRTYVIWDDESGTRDARILYNWGRTHSTGQFKVEITHDQHEAFRQAEAKITSKTHKGYEITRRSDLEVVTH